MKPIDDNMTIRSIIEQYPDAKGLFVAAGIGDLIEGDRFEKIAPFLTLKSALKTSNKDPLVFTKTLNEQILASQMADDVTLLEKKQDLWDAVGTIPMAIHLQMLEVFEGFRAKLERELGLHFEGRMASAHEGSVWMAEAYSQETDPCKLPDVCLGRGFDFYFSQSFKSRFIDTDVFNTVQTGRINPDFKGLGLRDPRGHYNVFSVIPAVIIVRQQALQDLPMPRTWEELLDEKYRGCIAMPDCTADLPRAVLLTLYSRFGEEAISRLAANICKLLHPSQFARKMRSAPEEIPAFSIMPYFFSQVVGSLPGVEVLWPEEGAILEPLYTLVKSDKEHFKSHPRAIKEAAEFFFGPEVASIFARAHFPVLRSDLDNGLPQDAPMWWLGWDFLEKHDVVALAENLQNLFEQKMPHRPEGCGNG